MPLKVVLCGPPGIGKTTLARRIRELHPEKNVIEFEELCSNANERASLMQSIADLDHISDVIMTCADVDVPRFIKGVQIVLLWTDDKARYSERTKKRDKDQDRPSQGHELWYDQHKQNFGPYAKERGYWVLDTFGKTPDECVKWIIAEMKKTNKAKPT